MLSNSWSLEAICGMIGNMQTESGVNPWRWQSDSVSLTDSKKGYGLPQFTPAYGYIDEYGKGIPGYAPNLSTSKVTDGASPSDGQAQIICIDEDRAGKFMNRSSYCKYADIRGYFPLSAFKQGSDLWLSTVAWLFHYEFPASQYRTEAAAKGRYTSAVAAFEYLKSGEVPTPPDPPPTPPTPPGETGRRRLPIYMYPCVRGHRW